MKKPQSSPSPVVTSVRDLLAIAYRIETDAVERYTMLADQMEAHNNPELTAVFRDLARAEGLHADEILRLANDPGLAEHASRLGNWRGDSPEEVDLNSVHYMMTPWHALQLSLVGEQRALDFFKQIMESTADAKVKELASEFVEEEFEHVNLVHRLLRKYPRPSATWSDDPDAPNQQG